MKYRSLAQIIVLVVAIITAAAGYLSSKLEFDYDFEHFFPTNDPDLEFYFDYRDRFATDNDFFLVGIENREGVFKQDFLKKVAALTDTMAQVEFVKEVTSPTNITSPVVGAFGIMQVPFLHIDQPERYKTDSIRIFESPNLVGTFFSADGKSISLNVMHQQRLSKAGSDSLLSDIMGIMEAFDFDAVHFAGRIQGQAHYVEKMQWEVVVFVSTAVMLLVFFLWFSFRTWWGIVVPILIVLISATWLLGFMKATGRSIDLMTTLLPTILFVVGMSDVVHLLSKYLEELRKGRGKIESLRTSVREIGLATFLTSFTTGIGFLTLLTATIMPVRQFGVYTAIGVVFAFILSFTLFPSVLVLMKKPAISEQPTNKLFWWRNLHRLFGWVLSHQKSILVGTVVVIGLSLWGINNVKVDNYLLEDLREGDPLLADFRYFEEEFSGVRPFEMAVWVPDSSRSMFDPDVLRQLDTIEEFLMEDYEVSFLFSPATVVKSAHQALNGGRQAAYQLPDSEKDWARTLKVVEGVAGTDKLSAFVTSDGLYGRVNGKIVDLGGHEIAKRNERFHAFLDQHIDSSLIQVRLTGTALLIDKNNQDLSENMLTGLLIAFGVIALLVGLMYRSIPMVLISLIPNVLPLVLIGGYMGAAGIDLKVSTSIIFTIAFGIAVDDTIHFVSKLRIELGKGKPLPLAIKRTFLSTGKAIIVTSIILCAGFVTLILSTFSSTYYIGLLITLTLALAVVSDLLLMPVLLLMFYGKQGSRLAAKNRKRIANKG